MLPEHGAPVANRLSMGSANKLKLGIFGCNLNSGKLHHADKRSLTRTPAHLHISLPLDACTLSLLFSERLRIARSLDHSARWGHETASIGISKLL